jgi:hypothetical protein
MSALTAETYNRVQDPKMFHIDKKTNSLQTRDLVNGIPTLQSVPAGPANEVSIATFRAFLVHFSLFHTVNTAMEALSLLNAKHPILSYFVGKIPSSIFSEGQQSQITMLETSLSGHLHPTWYDPAMKPETALQLLQLFHDFDVLLFRKYAEVNFPQQFTLDALGEQYMSVQTLQNDEKKPLIRSIEWANDIVTEEGFHCPDPRNLFGELGYLSVALSEASLVGIEERRKKLIVCTTFGCYEADGMLPDPYGFPFHCSISFQHLFRFYHSSNYTTSSHFTDFAGSHVIYHRYDTSHQDSKKRWQR